MRYDPEKTKERLDGVPMKDRVFIYNASIIIEFLNQTLMPTAYFLNDLGLKTMGSGQFELRFLKDPKAIYEKRFSLGDLYEFYKLFRQQKDYTAPVESRYKFSVILKKLSFAKNGWKFSVRRVSRAQFVYFAPAELRVRVPLAERSLWPVGSSNLSQGQIEVTPADLDQSEEVERVEVKPDTFKEATYEFNIDVEPFEPDTNDPSQFPAEGSDIEGY